MQRAILLQTDATRSKQDALDEFSVKALETANFLLSKRRSKKLMELHKRWYLEVKKSTSFNSQVVCDIERCVVKAKGDKLNRITVKFNMPRNCKTFRTKSRFFVALGIKPKTYIPVPISQNRNYQRYISLVQNGWACKTYGLTSDRQVIAFLSKEDVELPSHKNVIGVDVNSKCFTASVLTTNGRVLKQLYFGKDIWVKRKKIMLNRSRLQSLADRGRHRAVQSLRRLKVYEQNFVKNRIGEVVADITDLALRYDAGVAIENLKRFRPKSKKYNREVLRIPFYLFRKNLEARCFDKNIPLNTVDAYHTSKWCSRCGAVAKSGHSSNYALFKCECGQVVNSDRKASLAVAVKSLLVRNRHTSNRSAFFQLTGRRVPVNGLLRSDDGFVSRAVHVGPIPTESLPF